MRGGILLFLLFAGLSSNAQEPGFHFGPRIGIGVSRFSNLPEMVMRNGTTVQAGIIANKQLTEHFAIEFTPVTGIYAARPKGSLMDGGKEYTYTDKYNVYSVEFPLCAKFSAGFGKIYLNAFAGPSLAFNMGGTHSLHYDDPLYNAKHGYSDHTMDDLRDGMWAGVAGTGIEFAIKNGILGIDMRVHHTMTPVGRIGTARFFAEAAVIGISWRQ